MSYPDYGALLEWSNSTIKPLKIIGKPAPMSIFRGLFYVDDSFGEYYCQTLLSATTSDEEGYLTLRKVAEELIQRPILSYTRRERLEVYPTWEDLDD